MRVRDLRDRVAGGAAVREQAREFREDERALDAGARLLDRCDDVRELEPDDEARVLEICIRKAPRAVPRDVEAERPCLANGPRQRLGRPEVERPVRFDTEPCVRGRSDECRGREDAAEPVAGADEGDGEPAIHCFRVWTCLTVAMPSEPANDAPYRLLDDVEFGRGVVVASFTNLYGCRIGDETRIGPFVEIQRDVVVGARCKIQSHSFLCSGVELEDEVFVGHGALFINDRFPRATTDAGELQGAEDWTLEPTIVERRAALGSGSVILGGVRIGAGALVGAGAVVTRDVAPGEVVAGVPARVAGRSAT